MAWSRQPMVIYSPARVAHTGSPLNRVENAGSTLFSVTLRLGTIFMLRGLTDGSLWKTRSVLTIYYAYVGSGITRLPDSA